MAAGWIVMDGGNYTRLDTRCNDYFLHHVSEVFAFYARSLDGHENI